MDKRYVCDGFYEESLLKKIEFLQKEVAHWQANVKEIAKQCKILRDRPDLPVDRTGAYQELVRLQERVRELEFFEQRYEYLTRIQGYR